MFNIDMKREVARERVENGRSVEELATRYGVSKASVSRWASRYMTESGISCGNPIEENAKLREEIGKLKEEITRISLERDVLENIILQTMRQGAPQAVQEG